MSLTYILVLVYAVPEIHLWLIISEGDLHVFAGRVSC